MGNAKNWAGGLAALVFVAWMVSGAISYAPEKARQDNALYTQFKSAIADTCGSASKDDCWQVLPDSLYLGNSTIEGEVKFGNGNCTLHIKAPQDNPRNVTVTFPSNNGRQNNNTVYKLADINYSAAVQGRQPIRPLHGQMRDRQDVVQRWWGCDHATTAPQTHFYRQCRFFVA